MDPPSCEEGNLATLDEYYRIETGLLGMVSGKPAIKHWVQKVVLCMPSKDRVLTPELTIQRLTTLKTGPSWKLAPRQVQALAS